MQLSSAFGVHAICKNINHHRQPGSFDISTQQSDTDVSPTSTSFRSPAVDASWDAGCARGRGSPDGRMRRSEHLRCAADRPDLETEANIRAALEKDDMSTRKVALHRVATGTVQPVARSSLRPSRLGCGRIAKRTRSRWTTTGPPVSRGALYGFVNEVKQAGARPSTALSATGVWRGTFFCE
jgi:hypothetical protein